MLKAIASQQQMKYLPWVLILMVEIYERQLLITLLKLYKKRKAS